MTFHDICNVLSVIGGAFALCAAVFNFVLIPYELRESTEFVHVGRIAIRRVIAHRILWGTVWLASSAAQFVLAGDLLL